MPVTFFSRAHPWVVRSPWPLRVFYGAVFSYLVLVRTHNITEQFWFLGDQVRDWRIAMRPISELPLVGAPSSAGGTMLGPIYYWVLWAIRVVLGPFFDNLPHTGAIGLSVIHSVADVVLLFALARRLDSVLLALAVVLFAATSPYEMALTATIWNPPLAVALSKLTIALVLLQERWSLGRTYAVVVTAWLSLQAHVGAIFTAAAAIGWMLFQPFLAREPRNGLAAGRSAVEIVLLLQIPYAVDYWLRPQSARPFAIGDSLGYAVRHPGSLRIVESARALGGVMDYLLFAPWAISFTGLLLLITAVIGLWVSRRNVRVLVVSIGPLALAVLGFAAWRGRMGEHYWYLPLIAPATIVLALPFAGGALRLRRYSAVAACVAVLATQPARCTAAWRIHRLPEYDALVRGSRQVARQTPRVRTIVASFLPPTSDPTLVYELLGGKLSPNSPLVAHIQPDGEVRYQEVH